MGKQFTTLVVIGTDYTGMVISCKFNYHMITPTMAPSTPLENTNTPCNTEAEYHINSKSLRKYKYKYTHVAAIQRLNTISTKNHLQFC